MIAMEKIVSYPQFPRGGGWPWETTVGSIRACRRQEGKGELWAFVMVSMGRNQGSRVSGFRMS